MFPFRNSLTGNSKKRVSNNYNLKILISRFFLLSFAYNYDVDDIIGTSRKYKL